MSSCVFCRIIAGELPASVVYEDDQCIVFMDIMPITDGHLLVVPKEHYPLVIDVPDELVMHLYKVAKMANKAIRQSDIRSEGINYFLADGVAAGQEVFHSHLHIVPRYRGDGFGLRLPKGYGKIADRAGLDAHCTIIKQNM